MYSVKKCRFEKEHGEDGIGYVIEEENYSVYPYWINKFLHINSFGSPNTARQYAYVLCRFLNYLEQLGLTVFEAGNTNVKNFIVSLSVSADDGVIKLAEGKVKRSTVSRYLTAIKQFYKFLYQQEVDFNVDIFEEKAPKHKESYLYGSVWEIKTYKFLISPLVDDSKPSREHIKWYTPEETEALLSSFRTLRDKAIFSLTLDGLRIDEALSLQKDGFNPVDKTYDLYRSKGKKTGEIERVAHLRDRTVNYIRDYLLYERDEVEDKLLDEGVVPDNYLFLNLRSGISGFGKPVTYRNYLKILKAAAERAGLDPKKIRTHSGRSTQAQILFDLQEEHPDELSDQMIFDMMGWRAPQSANPYKNRQNRKSAKRTIQLLERKESDEHNEGND